LATAAPQAITPSASFDIFSDKITVRWRAEDGYPSSFTLYRNTTDNSATATPILTNTTLTSYNDTNANNGQTYYYWIKANNAVGTSPFGNSADGRKGNSTLVSMYEPFDYSANSSPNGLNSGIGFNGAWNVIDNGGAVVISGAGLSYPNLQTSGNRIVLHEPHTCRQSMS